MNTDRELMQQALESLDWFVTKEMTLGQRYTNGGQTCLDAIDALRERLAQPAQQQDPDPAARNGWVLREVLFDNGEPVGYREPQQEPVAWMYEWNGTTHFTTTDQRPIEKAHPHFNKSTPLYTAPQQEPVAGAAIAKAKGEV